MALDPQLKQKLDQRIECLPVSRDEARSMILDESIPSSMIIGGSGVKPRDLKKGDLAVVGLLQLAGLAYGLWTVNLARPDAAALAPIAGVTRVLLPARNRRDFEEIPEEARKALEEFSG